MVLYRTALGQGPRLVILHGMLGQGRNWQSVARLLSARLHVILADLRNHGSSPHGRPMDYHAMAADVAETLDADGIAATALLGHSMGGKVAMTLALTQSRRVERLVVVDVAPTQYPPENLHLVRAMRAVDLAAVQNRKEVDEALRASVPEDPTRAFLLQGLENRDGRWAWKCDLEAMEESMPVLCAFPELGPQAIYHGPTLVVAGGRSEHVRPEHEPLIARMFPDHRIARVADAGHWVHSDRPQAVAALVGGFLSPSLGA